MGWGDAGEAAGGGAALPLARGRSLIGTFPLKEEGI